MKEFTYEIKKRCGILGTSRDGKYSTEVNMISFNDAPAKMDIRRWNRETGEMMKGISLTKAEADNLLILLHKMKENG